MKEILAICSFFIFAQHLPLHTGEKIMHIGEKIIYSAHYIPARIHHQKLWGNNNAIAAAREKNKEIVLKKSDYVLQPHFFFVKLVSEITAVPHWDVGALRHVKIKCRQVFFWVSEEFLTNMWNHFDYRRLSLEANFAREKYATT